MHVNIDRAHPKALVYNFNKQADNDDEEFFGFVDM